MFSEIDPDDWARWTLYLLQDLDRKAAEAGPGGVQVEAFENVLGDVRDGIDARLEDGEW
jgi:hypothetical protein